LGNVSLAARHRRFSVDEYYRMAEAGILHEDDRVELLDGEIIEMTPIGSLHAACVDRLTRFFVSACGDRAIVRVQNPVRLSTESEPEPDLAILRPRADYYARAHPGPADVLLVIEVADSSLDYDRGRKAEAYARSGIPELWIVDLASEVVFVCRDPRAGSYRVEETRRRGQRLEVAGLAGVALAVDQMFPT
jgi:Uma2 family endonuclease